ncbi:GNAT family N-acetyltransferase [Alphaproteobacteria bacterium]|nr:GNAT family N-acetyltransferase [Alphaproteobacteria bacterium]
MMVKRDIRLATLADLALMHEWVNADDSLKWKKDTKHIISKEEHAEWFQSRLADPVTQIWIILDDDAPSGQVRLEKKGDLVYVDIYVVADVRGTGLAGFALNESINRYTKLFGSQKFCAIVNPENEMSEKLFVKNGFQKATSKSAYWLQFVRVALAY